jgi:Mrp family chromosome partitioning ATPase
MSESSCSGCSSQSSCSTAQAPAGPSAEERKLASTLGRIKRKVVVLSGKGGVGKSTVAVNIALALAQAGRTVGLLDVDVHGPSLPRLLSLTDAKPHIEPDCIEPISWSRNLWVMSLGFMLPGPEQAVIWRGAMKNSLIVQFLRDVAWGDLDFLVVDCPPGTGDEPLTTLQTIGPEALAVVVTTPQILAVDDVRRSISFCREMGTPVLGVVENMSGFVCEQCGHTQHLFTPGGGKKLAEEMGVPFLGAIPLDPELARSGDEGFPFVKVCPDSPTTQAVNRIVAPLLRMTAG